MYLEQSFGLRALKSSGVQGLTRSCDGAAEQGFCLLAPGADRSIKAHGPDAWRQNDPGKRKGPKLGESRRADGLRLP